jgi:hypothetical protein
MDRSTPPQYSRTIPVSNPSEGGIHFAKALTVTRTPKVVIHVTVQMMTTVSNATTTKTTTTIS